MNRIKDEDWDSIPEEYKKRSRDRYILTSFYGCYERFGVSFANDAAFIYQDTFIAMRGYEPTAYFVKPYQVLLYGKSEMSKTVFLNSYDEKGAITNCYEEQWEDYGSQVYEYKKNIWYNNPVKEGTIPYDN